MTGATTAKLIQRRGGLSGWGKGGGALFDGRYRKEKDAAHTYAKKSVPRPLPWCVESARASKWGGLNSESRTDVRKRVPLSFDEERTSNK